MLTGENLWLADRTFMSADLPRQVSQAATQEAGTSRLAILCVFAATAMGSDPRSSKGPNIYHFFFKIAHCLEVSPPQHEITKQGVSDRSKATPTRPVKAPE